VKKITIGLTCITTFRNGMVSFSAGVYKGEGKIHVASPARAVVLDRAADYEDAGRHPWKGLDEQMPRRAFPGHEDAVFVRGKYATVNLVQKERYQPIDIETKRNSQGRE
jgi:hypothetical protein